ncbi:MAG TPA: hypothetical protein VM537_32930, partial [Anaerolineae bacterium]|nr:hypothetical protein [Anaerolineae bacterium]
AAGMYETAVVRDLVVMGGNAYLATDDGLDIVSIGSPSNPTGTGSLPIEFGADAIAVGNGHAYLASGHVLHVVNVGAAAAPKEVNTLVLAGDNIRDLAIEGNFLYMARGSGGVEVWFVGNPGDPSQVGKYKDTSFGVSGVEVYNRLVFASAGGSGLVVLRNTAPEPQVQVRPVNDGVQLSGGPLAPGISHPLSVQDLVSMSGGSQLELTGDCVQDLVLLLLIYRPANVELAELIPALLAAHPDLCSSLAAAGLDRSAAASSRISLALQQGAVEASPRLAELALDISTRNATVSSSGRNTFIVAYDLTTATTSVATLSGVVTVMPDSGPPEPLQLPWGFSVDVTEAGFGPILSTQTVAYLPMVHR